MATAASDEELAHTVESNAESEATGEGAKAPQEEGECAFCSFMKAGPCGTAFKAWEDCLEEAEKVSDDTVTKCRGMTESLVKCMQGFTDYYGVVLDAGKQQQNENSNVETQDQGQDQQQPNEVEIAAKNNEEHKDSKVPQENILVDDRKEMAA